MSNISGRVNPNCVVCSPSNTNGLQLEFVSREDGGITATFKRGKDLEGYQGVVHGGIVSLILDGAIGHCMFSRGQVAMTVKMTTKFRHPFVTNQQAIVSANIVQGKSKKERK
jgi:acyl-coenzyme A thioesterase PaaI-like protein